MIAQQPRRAPQLLQSQRPSAATPRPGTLPCKTIRIFINRQKYELEEPQQTGAALKNLAGIPLNDVLFLQKKGDDLVIANDACVTLKNGDQLHSQPAADYGNEAWLADADLDVSDAELRAQTNGWTWLIIRGFALPRGYSPQSVDLLVKLPPLFPEAAPDMFWVSPAVRAPGGRNPRATSSEVLLGASWQRFSWHLAKGAWAPGRSTLRDYLRCIRGRFQRGD